MRRRYRSFKGRRGRGRRSFKRRGQSMRLRIGYRM